MSIVSALNLKPITNDLQKFIDAHGHSCPYCKQTVAEMVMVDVKYVGLAFYWSLVHNPLTCDKKIELDLKQGQEADNFISSLTQLGDLSSFFFG